MNDVKQREIKNSFVQVQRNIQLIFKYYLPIKTPNNHQTSIPVWWNIVSVIHSAGDRKNMSTHWVIISPHDALTLMMCVFMETAGRKQPTARY